MLHVLFQCLLALDEHVGLDPLVALEDVDPHAPEEIFCLGEHVVGFFQKPLYQPLLAGHGCVNDDDELFDFPHLAGLQRLDQRHIPIHFHSVVVENVIKAVRIDLHLLMEHRKFSQEFLVVITGAVADPQLLLQLTFPLRGLVGEKHHLCLHPFPDIIPFFPVGIRIFRAVLRILLPETVVVQPELHLPAADFRLHKRFLYKFINSFRSQHRQLFPQSRIHTFPECS